MRLAFITILLGLMLVGCSKSDRDASGTEFTRLMNRGKAYLENRNAKAAVEVLRKAVQLSPDSETAYRNLARAYLLGQEFGQAHKALVRAEQIEPNQPATAYLLGISCMRKSQFQESIPFFEKAIRLDPNVAALRFQLANAYQVTGQSPLAKEQLLETVRINPFHASAHFKLSDCARRDGDREALRRHTREFMRLRKLFGNETRSAQSLEQCVYTRPESAFAVFDSTRSNDAPALEIHFRDATAKILPDSKTRPAVAVAFLEINDGGAYSFCVVKPDGRLTLLQQNAAGSWQESPTNIRLDTPTTDLRCVPGDFHNDVPAGQKYDPKLHAQADLLIARESGVRLLKRTGPAAFADVTGPAGLEGVSATRALWVDYEHDGDLDLVLGQSDGTTLWQNNGDGTFEPVGAEVGFAIDGPASDLVAVDLDGNIAVDLIVASASQRTIVFENQRAGVFKRMAEPPGPWPPARRVLVEDLNNDGTPDTIFVRAQEAEIRLSGMATSIFLTWTHVRATGAVLLDFDNDGFVDLLVFGLSEANSEAASILLYRNLANTWQDVTQIVGLSGIQLLPISDALTADLDRDGDTDLLLVTTEGLRCIENQGGHVNGQLKIRLIATKTNPSARGTHLELRRDEFWITRRVSGDPIELGLAGHKMLDAVQVIWTNGVVDNAIDVAPGAAPLVIVEKNVATGSCPFLYAWDGTQFRFVTDLLGNSPIGLPLSRETMLPADPDEFVTIGTPNSFRPRNGAYEVVVTDEFREVLYLDHAQLVAVDHSDALEIHPTDKLMPAPFPASELWALGNRQHLVSADSSDGLDRTAALQAKDGRFAKPGRPLPPPYRGMCHPLTLTFDFGPLDATAPLVLAMTGWLQYGDGSTNIAMSQNSELTVIPPSLEVETAQGDWQAVDVVVGMPAGKTKTILTDLTGKLPHGARRLRLTTTFEIRWDRVALFKKNPLPQSQIHVADPTEAKLAFRGFSELRQRTPGGPTVPEFDDTSRRPPWRTTLEGWCTRYGDVLELVRERDDRLVLVNAGDALTMRFPAASFPPVPRDLKRTFFFYSVGWDKDGDHNVVGGDMVDPLPVSETNRESVAGEPDESDWQIRFNTRWVPQDQFREPAP